MKIHFVRSPRSPQDFSACQGSPPKLVTWAGTRLLVCGGQDYSVYYHGEVEDWTSLAAHMRITDILPLEI